MGVGESFGGPLVGGIVKPGMSIVAESSSGDETCLRVAIASSKKGCSKIEVSGSVSPSQALMTIITRNCLTPQDKLLSI